VTLQGKTDREAGLMPSKTRVKKNDVKSCEDRSAARRTAEQQKIAVSQIELRICAALRRSFELKPCLKVS
jgi:hypothetical protein